MDEPGVDRRLRNMALLVAGCFFMEILDGTIAITAIPQIGSSLGVPTAAVSLVITAYLVTLAMFIPLSGWMSARFGARAVFLSAIVIFTLASAGCAASTSLLQLVAMRILQGMGGAMMVPVGRLVVLSRTPKPDLMRINSFLVWPALIAPVVAPLAGGVITTYASWQWIFLINLPLGGIAFLAAWRLISSPPGPQPPPLDRRGVLLTCAALAGLAFTAQLLSQDLSSWALVVAIGGLSLSLATVAVRHLLAARFPLVNLHTLKITSFGSSIAGLASLMLVIGGIPFLLPLLFQESFGWSPVKSGSVVLFLFLGNLGIKPATSFLFNRFGFRSVLVAATAGLVVTTSMLAVLAAGAPLAVIVAVLLASGACRSVGMTGYSTMAFGEIPSAEMRHANTLQATTQQLGLGLGVACAAVALHIGEGWSSAAAADGTDPVSFAVAFALVGCLALVATWRALRLERGAGSILRSERSRISTSPDDV